MTNALRTTSTETLRVAEAALGSSIRQTTALHVAADDGPRLMERVLALTTVRVELARRADAAE